MLSTITGTRMFNRSRLALHSRRRKCFNREEGQRGARILERSINMRYQGTYLLSLQTLTTCLSTRLRKLHGIMDPPQFILMHWIMVTWATWTIRIKSMGFSYLRLTRFCLQARPGIMTTYGPSHRIMFPTRLNQADSCGTGFPNISLLAL
jgi:hypothetical protein